MSRMIIFAEGLAAGKFDPLDQVRPPFLLRNGVWTVAHRWERLLRPDWITVAARPWLKDCTAEATGWTVNEMTDAPPDDVWLIIGTASPVQYDFWKNPDLPASFSWSFGHDSVTRISGSVWPRFRDPVTAWVQAGGAEDCPCSAPSIGPHTPILGATGLWHLVDHLALQLEFDWQLWRALYGESPPNPAKRDSTAVVIGEKGLWAAPDAEIGPHTVVDASAGAVILDAGSVIEPFTRLTGPAYVGSWTRLVGGKFTGPSAFGPGCRLGGEVETSIIQGFSNKVHEGFFGHGFVGEWANLGALTTNSDLKNTYGHIRVERQGETVDTGMIKVGSYLSDHTKTGIGTLLPTGATFGVGVNIVSGGLAEKSIPPFVWGGAGKYMEHDIERMLAAAQIAIGRRESVRASLGMARAMTPGEQNALRVCFERSASNRLEFLSAPSRAGAARI